MEYMSVLHKKLVHIYNNKISPFTKFISSLFQATVSHVKPFLCFWFQSIVSNAKPFWLQSCYLFVVTVFGYLGLKVTKPRTDTDYIPSDLDLFFTSASATTSASMSTVEMEVFSNLQLIIMVTIIFLGGEVFISLIALQLRRFFSSYQHIDLRRSCRAVGHQEQIIELSTISVVHQLPSLLQSDDQILLQNSMKVLGYVVTGYILVEHIIGISLISLYISVTTSAKKVLQNKGLVLQTFSLFTTVSTLANCGFLPTNENMMVFKKNAGLVLILTPLGLINGTLYPPCLRFVIWVMQRFTKRKEYSYMLKNYKELGYGHLMSSKECWLLVATVFGFLSLQFVTFCVMEWSSYGVMEGMSFYEKIVGSLFQVVNARHAGESLIDLSLVSSAILAMFIVMMYLPPYTSFLSIDYQQQEEAPQSKQSRRTKKYIADNFLFSQLTYLSIFIIIICITERKKLKEDPLNFNFQSILFEVVSAYGTVGFSTGYNCKRRIMRLDETCIDKSYGLTGWFTKEGKFTMILVMFYGRLKKYNIYGGRSWRLY